MSNSSQLSGESTIRESCTLSSPQADGAAGLEASALAKSWAASAALQIGESLRVSTSAARSRFAGARTQRRAQVRRAACDASAKLSRVVETTDADVRAAVRRYGFRVVAIEGATRRRFHVFVSTLVPVLLLANAAPFMLLSSRAKPLLARFSIPSFGLNDAVVMSLVFAAAYLACMWPALVPAHLKSKYRYLGFPVVVWISLSSLASATLGGLVYPTNAPLGISFAAVSLLVPVSFLLASCAGWYLIRSERASPDSLALLLRDLVATWHDLQNARHWAKPPLRQRAARRLHDAELVSQNLWKLLNPQNNEQRRWAKERGAEIAGSIRRVQREMIWSAADTRARLADEIGRICYCLVTFDLRDIGTESAPESGTPLTAGALFLGSIVIVAPLAAVLLVKLAGIPIRHEDYLSFAALLWLLLGVVVVAGPVLENRLPVLGTFMRIIGGK